jgi:alpha-glucosidase (family GH31 glycosyl hydrolase)
VWCCCHNAAAAAAQGAWYSLFDYSRLEGTGANQTLEVPQGQIPVHVRGGSIVPMQVRSPLVCRISDLRVQTP